MSEETMSGKAMSEREPSEKGTPDKKRRATRKKKSKKKRASPAKKRGKKKAAKKRKRARKPNAGRSVKKEDATARPEVDEPAPVQDAADRGPGTRAIDSVTAAAASSSTSAVPAGAPRECPVREETGDGVPVELSPEEALDLLKSLLSPEPDGPTGTDQMDGTFAVRHPASPAHLSRMPDAAADDLPEEAIGPVPCEPGPTFPDNDARDDQGALSGPAAPGTLRPPRFRVLTFEAVPVEPRMRVAGCTLARLSAMVARGEINAVLGPVCETAEEFVAEWHRTPDECPVVLLVNLSSAGEFTSRVAHECPGAEAAYWIVFETLRSDVSITTNRFLAELSSDGRLRAVGYGPRNVVEAARSGAEAAVGHVEWGFGGGTYLAEAG